MRLLVFVFAASVAALLWAAWAIARAVRRHVRARPAQRGVRTPGDERGPRHELEAVADRPGDVPGDQSVAKQSGTDQPGTGR